MDRLDEIPGVNRVAAAVLVAEIGVDMSRFPTADHLASWAKFTPLTQQSAHRQVGPEKTGRGNRYLAAVIGDIVAGAGRTDTFIGARYKRLRRRGKSKAIVACGRSLLVAIWHMLNDNTRFIDLGPQHYQHSRNLADQAHKHIKALVALGYQVTATSPIPA